MCPAFSNAVNQINEKKKTAETPINIAENVNKTISRGLMNISKRVRENPKKKLTKKKIRIKNRMENPPLTPALSPRGRGGST
jgi:hypothetical protein